MLRFCCVVFCFCCAKINYFVQFRNSTFTFIQTPSRKIVNVLFVLLFISRVIFSSFFSLLLVIFDIVFTLRFIYTVANKLHQRYSVICLSIDLYRTYVPARLFKMKFSTQCLQTLKIYACLCVMADTAVSQVVHVDFSLPNNAPSNTHPYQLKEGAQILPGPNVPFNALRIDSDGPHALIPGVDIGPSAMPDCTLMIGLYLESIANNRGWVFGHELWDWDRTILIHDSRFGGVASAVGKTWSPWLDDKGMAPTKEWIHVTAVFRQNGSSNVYLDGIPSDNQVNAVNNEGAGDLYIGRPRFPTGVVDAHPDHWVDSWIKEVKVFSRALNEDEIMQHRSKFLSSTLTSAPTTSAPTTSVPTTSIPTTSVPATSVPTTSIPTTSAPATSVPITSVPTTSAPATSVPTTSLEMFKNQDYSIVAPDVVFYDNGSGFFLNFTYTIGPDISRMGYELFRANCTSTNDVSNLLSIDTLDMGILDVAIDKRNISASPLVSKNIGNKGDSVGVVKFCVMAQSYLSDNTSVTFQKTDVNLSYDLSNNIFSVTNNNIEADAVEQSNSTVSTKYGVDVFRCTTSSFTEDTAKLTIQQNQLLAICLKPTDSSKNAVDIYNFDMYFVQGTTVFDPPVVTIGLKGPISSSLSSVLKDKQTYKVTSRVVTALFDGGSSFNITGNAYMVFNDGNRGLAKASKVLRSVQTSSTNLAGKSSFAMDVEITKFNGARADDTNSLMTTLAGIGATLVVVIGFTLFKKLA